MIILSFFFCQTKSSGGKKTANMRGGTRKTGGDPPQKSGKGGAYRSEKEEREIAYRLCVRQFHTADVGARRHRRCYLLGHPQGHLHHQCHDVLRGATSHQEVLRTRAGRQQKTSYFCRRTRPEARRRSVDMFLQNINRSNSREFTVNFTEEQSRAITLM